jgi:hypothetical protein
MDSFLDELISLDVPPEVKASDPSSAGSLPVTPPLLQATETAPRRQEIHMRNAQGQTQAFFRVATGTEGNFCAIWATREDAYNPKIQTILRATNNLEGNIDALDANFWQNYVNAIEAPVEIFLPPRRIQITEEGRYRAADQATTTGVRALNMNQPFHRYNPIGVARHPVRRIFLEPAEGKTTVGHYTEIVEPNDQAELQGLLL